MSTSSKPLSPEYLAPFITFRLLDDGRIVAVEVQLMGSARLVIGQAGAEYFDDVWQYDSPLRATQALYEWDVEKDDEPAGWIRHPASGRRRPGGDANKEYFNP